MDDLAALVALERAIFPTFWNEKTLREVMDDPKYLVLLERDEKNAPAAYLIGWIIGDEAELARIGVVPERRGQGLAGRLLDSALEIWKSRGAARVFLDVRQSNEAARRLYQSRGFQVVGKRADYYENGEAALLMALMLS